MGCGRMLGSGTAIVVTVFNSHKMDRSPAVVKDLEDPLEKRLLAMLRDGICDLYTVIAVLDASGRIPAEAKTPALEHPADMRVVWPV